MSEYFDAAVLAELAGASNAEFKAFCARLGITLLHQDEQLLVDRDGMRQLRDAAENAGAPDLAVVLQLALDTGGRRQP